MNKIIEVKNINKKYISNNKTILNDLNLSIYKNEFLTIGGESGSGKSTFLRILGLIDTEFEGEFIYNKTIIKQDSPLEVETFRKEVLGIVFQDFYLIDRYTIYRNLELALIVQNTKVKVREKLIKEVLNTVNLEHDILNRYPDEISGGQKQRVAIARTILSQPKILLADEPTGSLDDDNAQEIIDLFKSLDITLVIATHDLRIARISDRHIIIKDGLIC